MDIGFNNGGVDAQRITVFQFGLNGGMDNQIVDFFNQGGVSRL